MDFFAILRARLGYPRHLAFTQARASGIWAADTRNN